MIKAWKKNIVRHIDTKALLANYASLTRRLAPRTKVMCVVKGNAYGHGIESIVPALSKMKPDYYAVFTVEEALRVRVLTSHTPILVLCPADSSFVSVAVERSLHLSVTSLTVLRSLTRSKQTISIHLCIESGLGRDGIMQEDMSEVLRILKQNPQLLCIGLYTHFSGAESSSFDVLTHTQATILHLWQQKLVKEGIHPSIHMSGTAGTLKGSMFHGNIVRLGLGLYGLWPSDETKKYTRGVTLAPVMSLTTYITDLKTLPKNHGIGYDETYITKKSMQVAVLPVGYADGLPRSLSSNAFFIARGVRVPVRGRIMMNTCVVDMSRIKGAKIGDTVTLIGAEGNVSVTADELAKRAGTINYELVTRMCVD